MVVSAFSNLTSKEVEITLGPAYANDVYYSFKNGVVKEVPTANWDIAFQTYSQNAGILVNTAKGLILYVAKNYDVDSWDKALDTTGMSATWDKGYNSIDKWHVGAFNLGLDGFEMDGDFGWGAYNQTTHAVVGTKVYVVKLSATNYKKIMIESLLSSVYTVIVADLDGKNEKKFKIAKKDYANKLYVYYNLTDNTVVDREPEYTTWDLVIGKYTDLIDNAGTITPYTVTGIRTHPLFRTAVVKGVPTGQSTAPEINDDNYSKKITTIGSNWKKFDLNNNKWIIPDSISYFVTSEANGTTDGNIYKIVFKSFEGSSTGKFKFELNGGVTSIEEKQFSQILIYPNIIEKGENISLSLDNTDLNDLRSLKIYSVLGNNVASLSNIMNNEILLPVKNLSTGEYLIVFEFNNKILTSKLIVK